MILCTNITCILGIFYWQKSSSRPKHNQISWSQRYNKYDCQWTGVWETHLFFQTCLIPMQQFQTWLILNATANITASGQEYGNTFTLPNMAEVTVLRFFFKVIVWRSNMHMIIFSGHSFKTKYVYDLFLKVIVWRSNMYMAYARPFPQGKFVWGRWVEIKCWNNVYLKYMALYISTCTWHCDCGKFEHTKFGVWCLLVCIQIICCKTCRGDTFACAIYIIQSGSSLIIFVE